MKFEVQKEEKESVVQLKLKNYSDGVTLEAHDANNMSTLMVFHKDGKFYRCKDVKIAGIATDDKGCIKEAETSADL